MKKLLVFVTFALLASHFFVLPLHAQQTGRILYVNRTDSTCAGQSPCFATIQSAIETSTSRDTIRIQPGTYPEQLTIQKNDFTSASESDRIIIEADPGAAPASVELSIWECVVERFRVSDTQTYVTCSCGENVS